MLSVAAPAAAMGESRGLAFAFYSTCSRGVRANIFDPYWALGGGFFSIPKRRSFFSNHAAFLDISCCLVFTIHLE